MDVREQLCYSDAYARTVEATVADVLDGGKAPLVVLDRTVFYPGGGGQPSDRGLLLRTADGRNWTLWPGFTFDYWWRTRRLDPSGFDWRSA